MAEKMLIIDDEEIVLKSCQKIFEAEGFNVVVTASPQEGLKLVAESSFDVILCDWMMPGFDGMDVVEEIDRRSPNSAVVMISGYPTVAGQPTVGRGVVMSPPFRPVEIMEAVKMAVRRKVTEEKKAMGRFEKIMKSWQFPVPTMEDKTPKSIAETVAQTVGVAKATSPWFTVSVLGILAGAYIGFGGLLSTAVTFDWAQWGLGQELSLGRLSVLAHGFVITGQVVHWQPSIVSASCLEVSGDDDPEMGNRFLYQFYRIHSGGAPSLFLRTMENRGRSTRGCCRQSGL
jgi:CheY-like chemotaxis protein